jgi:hypothetical protein
VPFASVLDLVVVRATEHEIFIYASDLSVLARHARAPHGHPDPVVDPAHRPARKPRHDVDALTARLSELGDGAALFAAGVCRAQRYRGEHLVEVLALVARYDAGDLLRALDRAVRYRAFDSGVIVRILAATATPRPLPSTEDERIRARIRDHGALLPGATRSIEVYADALKPLPDEDEPEEH